ncbi:twitching motility protein PilT [Herbaspirillum hiltneri N3]|uniref:Twitching motility protein PilT n=1 Tax=Herbaspirillum hiltneri N3 TaxID=1262470 RepID=A0ABM5UYG2_9BURK|nr:type IV pilus twitching motility protein PilT [Herbaspirillum hiltneri]AKZ62255.1 twitching motility protein PilT [Herbaspirillum hiltneri N3]
MDIPDLLAFSVKNQASDLHLSTGLPPMLRLRGDMRRVNLPVLEAQDVGSMLDAIMDASQAEAYRRDLECDFAVDIAGLARFRINAFHQARGPAAVIRTIPHTVRSLTELDAPPVLSELALRRQGLVLVTGPTGSGKSTTLAAMIRHINEQRSAHILTIEDPIEFIHTPDKSLVSQRAVGTHTRSFANALRSALREDPDVILIGELRDLDTIRLALTAAETGHLVLATLHTSSAAKSVDRIVDVFPGDEKEMVRSMLSESLSAVVSQILLKTRAGDDRIAAHEIMLGTPAIRNLIREGKVAQMVSVMQTSAGAGMQTLDHCLGDLLRREAITPETARAASRTPGQFA